MTTAMDIAKSWKGAPGEEWIHDLELKSKDGNTVKRLLEENNIEVPNYWKDS